MSKTVAVNVALDEKVVGDLDMLAKADQRNRSQMLRMILVEGVRHRMGQQAKTSPRRVVARA